MACYELLLKIRTTSIYMIAIAVYVQIPVTIAGK